MNLVFLESPAERDRQAQQAYSCRGARTNPAVDVIVDMTSNSTLRALIANTRLSTSRSGPLARGQAARPCARAP